MTGTRYHVLDVYPFEIFQANLSSMRCSAIDLCARFSRICFDLVISSTDCDPMGFITIFQHHLVGICLELFPAKGLSLFGAWMSQAASKRLVNGL